jgi:hypothetical protein
MKEWALLLIAAQLLFIQLALLNIGSALETLAGTR